MKECYNKFIEYYPWKLSEFPTYEIWLLTKDECSRVFRQGWAASNTKDREGKFRIGDHVRKTKGSQWSGKIVGEYSTTLTPEGYAVESSTERGSVQIYPAAALELVPG